MTLSGSANADAAAVGRNALTSYLAWIVNFGLGLVITPILLRRLGADGFGAWTLALTLASYVGIVELGLGVATVRHIAAALARGDRTNAEIVIASAYSAYLVLALAGLLVLAVLTLLPGNLVHSGTTGVNHVRLAVLVVGLGLIISSIAQIYPAVAIGTGRADLGTRIGIVLSLAMGVAQAASAIVFQSVIAVAATTAIGVVATNLAVRAVVKRRLGAVNPGRREASRKVVQKLLRSGWRNGAIAIAAGIAIQSDVLVVGAFLAPAAVAAYGIAVRASGMVRSLATRATDVLVPTYAHSTALKETERTVRAFKESIFLNRAILAPTVVILLAFGDSLLRVWLGEVPHGSRSVLLLLVVLAFVTAPGYSAFVLLTGMDRLNFVLVGSVSAAITNLGLSLLLTSRIGITGPAVGSLAVAAAWEMLILPRYVGVQLRIPWIPLSLSEIWRLMPPLAAASLTAFLLERASLNDTERLGASAAVGAVYLLVLVVTAGRERRQRYGHLLTGALRLR